MPFLKPDIFIFQNGKKSHMPFDLFFHTIELKISKGQTFLMKNTTVTYGPMSETDVKIWRKMPAKRTKNYFLE